MTDSAELKIAKLVGLRSKLNAGDQKFAGDLIEGRWGFRTRGFLSGKQWPWVDSLIERAENADKPAPKFEVPLDKVHDFLMQARKTLKYPKLWMRVGDADVKLYLSGKKSGHPNTVNIVSYTTQGAFRDDNWLGRILKDGTWHKPFRVRDEDVRSLMPALQKLADDPGAVAMEYGKLTGRCCFCNHTLTDEDRSTQVGFGPVCAKRYGLQDYWRKGDGKTAHVAMVIKGNRPDMRN